MQRLQIADAKMMEMALKNEILRSEEARYDHRLHGVLLVCQGYSCYDVGQMFGHHSTTIQRWLKSFEMHGFSGLEDQPKAGRPPRLTPGQWQLVDHHLRQSPRQFGYSQNLWSGTDEAMIDLAKQNAVALSAGHSFIVFLGEGYFPINVLNAIKAVPEVARIFCATANPTEVIVAETAQGRGILGVIDGFKSKGIEDDEGIAWRKNFLRMIGYKVG